MLTLWDTRFQSLATSKLPMGNYNQFTVYEPREGVCWGWKIYLVNHLWCSAFLLQDLCNLLYMYSSFLSLSSLQIPTVPPHVRSYLTGRTVRDLNVPCACHWSTLLWTGHLREQVSALSQQSCESHGVHKFAKKFAYPSVSLTGVVSPWCPSYHWKLQSHDEY